MGKDLARAIPLVMYWLGGASKKFAFSVSVIMKGSYERTFPRILTKWLNPLADHSPYSVLKRSKKGVLCLVLSSKNWDYCLAGDKWKVDCKECELDLYGWEDEGDVWSLE